jgi:hypothetical protein
LQYQMAPRKLPRCLQPILPGSYCPREGKPPYTTFPSIIMTLSMQVLTQCNAKEGGKFYCSIVLLSITHQQVLWHHQVGIFNCQPTRF